MPSLQGNTQPILFSIQGALILKLVPHSANLARHSPFSSQCFHFLWYLWVFWYCYQRSLHLPLSNQAPLTLVHRCQTKLILCCHIHRVFWNRNFVLVRIFWIAGASRWFSLLCLVIQNHQSLCGWAHRATYEAFDSQLFGFCLDRPYHPGSGRFRSWYRGDTSCSNPSWR